MPSGANAGGGGGGDDDNDDGLDKRAKEVVEALSGKNQQVAPPSSQTLPFFLTVLV